MEKFRISDFEAAFTADLQRFLDETRGHLGLLIAGSPESQVSLDEIKRYAHTLKGLAATVEAWGLSNWGADLEKLFEVAGTFLDSSRDKAEEIFRFVIQHMESWHVMNKFTLAEQFGPAFEYYQGLRILMEEQWGGYLAPVVTAIPQETPPEKPQPEPAAAPPAPSEASLQLAPATPPNLAPPPLRRRSAKRAAHSAASPLSPQSIAPARPAPLALPPPPLLRAPSGSPPPAPVESGATTPALPNPAPVEKRRPLAVNPPNTPFLRIMPPALLRKAKGEKARPIAGRPDLKAPELIRATSTPGTPTAPPAPTDEPTTGAIPVTDDFAPAVDADILEMLTEEVAGYLGELTGTLKSLAANLGDQESWETTRRLFHTIKGTAATLHLDAVSLPAKAAEARCIVAVEDKQARTTDAFEACLERATVIADALNLSFVREEVVLALEQARARSAAAAAAERVDSDTPIDSEMAGFFIRDARDQIEVIEQAALRWERGENTPDQIWAAQRGFHTLKGAANSIGLTRVARSVHEAEGFLEGVAAGSVKPSPALFTFLLGAVDQLRTYLKDLAENPAARWRHSWAETLSLFGPVPEQTAPAVDPPRAAEASRPIPSDSDSTEDEAHTLRIDATRLHKLMNLIGEVVIDRARLEKKIELLTGLHQALGERHAALTASVQAFQQQFEFNLLQDQTGPSSERGARNTERGAGDSSPVPGPEFRVPSADSEFSEVEFDRYDQFSILARSLVEISRDVEDVSGEVSNCLESFGAENARFRETSRHLQENVTGLSLLPVSTLFPRLQRAFRDAVQVEHKEADLTLEGGSASLDKVVIDKIFTPLMHLLRNAVAHGIETPAVREALKKPARGQVRVSTTQLSNQIIIQITDDGSGVNADAVRQRAIEKGWLRADAPTLKTEEVIHFIFQPGFSTASKLTSVSGRGVGLDVVRKEIEGLNGSVELHYEPGAGSTWTLRLPLTLLISEAILAECGRVTYAFPINFIEAGLIIETSSLQSEGGRDTCAVGETRLPVARLSELLEMPGGANASNGLIISAGDRRGIIAVDRVLRRQEIVVKQLDSVFAGHPLLNGATLDAEGRVIPILNLPTLLKFSERRTGSRRARAERRVEAVSETARFRVLIVDDSLSVRKVQERLLTELGCQVTPASDGLHALEKLREGRFDFVFTDLEMPRLNGYELIAELRSNPAWSLLPVVVISSRGADKYITKAMNVGATTFLSKPFTQQQLEQVLAFYGGWNSKTRVRVTPATVMQEAV